MSQKVYLWILKIGVIASFLCVFFVFKNLLFPYITSKQIPFNILTEVLLVFWAAFIIKYPQWNPFKGFTKTWPVSLFVKPKQSVVAAEVVAVPEIKDTKNRDNKNIPAELAVPAPINTNGQFITFGLLAFFVVILISCFTGIDFHMSFWSNAERMLGVYHILHFFILYLVVITVFRDWGDWKVAFTSLLAAAVGVAIGSSNNGVFVGLVIMFLIFAIVVTATKGFNSSNKGPLGDTVFMIFALLLALFGVSLGYTTGHGQIYSTLGNSLYAAVFMIFAFHFALLLFFHKDVKEEKGSRSWMKWFYFLAIPFLYMQFYKVNKAGEAIGLLMGVATFVFLFGIVGKQRILKIVSWFLAFAVIGTIVFAFTFHTHPIITKNRFLSKFNTNRATFQTRLISWEGGVKDFHNHWLLGTGFGNYAIIFDKYFQSKFYNYAKSETYFDRAHNNVIDITSTTGILGIVTYLSFLVAAGFYLVRAYRRGRIKPIEFCLIASLLVAYFVQNLDVFDSFVSYMCLMIVLGYIHWLANSGEDRGNTRALLAAGGEKGFIDREIFTLIGVGLISVFLIYNYAVMPWRMFIGVINGQMAFGKGDVLSAVQIYKEALAHNTPLSRDSRSMLQRAVADNAWLVSKLSKADAADVIAFAVEQGEKNLSNNPQDSLMNMELARVYDIGYKIVDDPALRKSYGEAALERINKSIAVSTQRVPTYFIKSQFELSQNRIDDSIKTLEYAATISNVFPEAYCQLGQVYLIQKNQLQQTKGATSSISEFDGKAWKAMDTCLNANGAGNLMIPEVMKESINHYSEKQDLDKIIQLYEQLVQYEKNAQYFVTLAKLYEQKGDFDKAIWAAGEAGKVDPKLKTDADAYIKQLEGQK